MTSFPVEFAWLVPVVAPFVVGLLIGAIIKRTMKLVTLLAALVIVLVVTGFLNMTFQDLMDKAMEMLPRIVTTSRDAVNLLPYASTSFLIGLAIGLWKG